MGHKTSDPPDPTATGGGLLQRAGNTRGIVGIVGDYCCSP